MPAGLEDARVLAQHLLFCVAQHARDRRVDGQDARLRIGHHHALDGVVHHGRRQALALLQRTAGREVGEDAGETLGLPLCATVAHAARLEPAIAVVKAPQARRLGKRLARGHGPLHGPVHAPIVIRVQAAQQIHAARQLGALVAQQAHQTGRMGGAAAQQVPVPQAAAAAFQRQAQHVFAVQQVGARGANLPLAARHARQQPPGQRPGQQHIQPALEGLPIGQLLRLGDAIGQQGVARGHPGRAQNPIQGHAPPGADSRVNSRCNRFQNDSAYLPRAAATMRQ